MSFFLIRKTTIIVFFCFFQLTNKTIASSESSASLSFCIADLKFTGNTLKICELGQGVFSTFRGYDLLYGKGALWAQVWAYMAQFNKPVWLISPRINNESIKDFAVSDLEKMGGGVYRTLLQLKGNSLFKKNANISKGLSKPSKIENISAFIFVRKDVQCLQNFIKKYPSVLVIDEQVARFVGNKYLTDQLFQDDEALMKYRPKCFVCSKYLSTMKINKLLCGMASEYYVIKPINSSMGRGIIIVGRQDLVRTLQHIFCRIRSGECSDDEAIDYWKRDKNDMFLIEEYAPSKQVCIDDKWYDPTMRVAFIVVVDNGNTKIKILDAYWKLPGKDLGAVGSFTELHKSHVVKGVKSSAPVEPDDFKNVCTILEDNLVKLFYKMHTINGALFFN